MIKKNHYEELNPKIFGLLGKIKRKMESHINGTPKAVTKLIISPEFKTNLLYKFVY
jgi:hypothetical protein